MSTTSLSNPPEPLPMNPSSQHWTIPSTNTLPSSVISQPPTFLSLTSEVLNSQPIPPPYTFGIPTCAPLSSQLQTFDGTDYRYRPEIFLKGIEARTIYQLGREPTNSEQYRIWNSRRAAHVATFLDGPVSSWFKSLSETDTQDWSKFPTKFLK